MDTLVAAIIERDGGELLMVRRAQGTWGFPTGLRRPVESYEAAIRRVVRESLGAEFDIHTGQPPVEGEHDGRKALFRFFLGHVAEDEARPVGIDEIRWMKLSEIREQALDPLTRKVADWYAEGMG